MLCRCRAKTARAIENLALEVLEKHWGTAIGNRRVRAQFLHLPEKGDIGMDRREFYDVASKLGLGEAPGGVTDGVGMVGWVGWNVVEWVGGAWDGGCAASAAAKPML